MAYVSLIVQYLTNPQNLYELILRHRQALLLFSFAFNFVLILRFGLPAFAFSIFYELTKFYLFGDRFLAEAFIVYPLIYLVGLVWLRLQNIQFLRCDYIFSGILVWFIIFMREPYVPAAILLFLFLLWDKKILQRKMLALLIFFILSFITVFYHDVSEFLFNVVTVNIGLASSEITNPGLTIFQAFFYPIVLFFGGEWGHFRYLIIALDILFLLSFIIMIWKRQWKFIFFLFITLGLLNIRYVMPGKAFYGSFHLLCWYGVFIFVSFLMLAYIYKVNKKFSLLIAISYVIVLIYHILTPSSFLQSKPNPHYELITNYGSPMQIGMVINSLSSPSDKLFVDGFDDIIYWQAKIFSDYKYSWYTSLMPAYKKYTDARLEMFMNNPPDFYYGSCPKEKNLIYLLPEFIKNDYIRLYSGKNPSCLWIKKTKLVSITNNQWEKAKVNYYNLSEINN
jgi:hypothetical protein